ncbi:MAG TPA: class I SAM-dependent methyltransferase [Acidobacteriaceae bacterium]
MHPFDRLHGTETSGLLPGEIISEGTTAMPSELTAYYGIAPSILRSLLDTWLQRTSPAAPIEQTVLFDVGAGKGRAMLLASQYPFLRVEGIEFNEELAAIAQSNIARWENDSQSEALASISLHHGDALLHPLPPEPTVVFMFHPFERALTSRFLRHIDECRAGTQIPLDLIYANAEYHVLLERHPRFQHLWSGSVPMSTDDHVADLAEIAQQTDYGSTGDEFCTIYRYTGYSELV